MSNEQNSDICFSEEDKLKFFDTIADCFYRANFGELSKADMELMMFGFYLDKMNSTYQDSDGVLDYNKCSDYRISKKLGITPQRVRNLKVKYYLRNPMEYDWKLPFSRLIKNARYDSQTHKVTLNIPDPILYLEIQNFLEDQGAYIEMQLNSKILQIRAEYFLELCTMLEDQSVRKKIVKQLKEAFKASQKDNTAFDEKHIGKSIINSASTIANIVSGLSPIIGGGSLFVSQLVNLIKESIAT